MLAYPSFVYLQNHKTGCTFVEEGIRRFCSEPLQAYRKHAALDQPAGRFSFTNVREPLMLYRSLHAYGLDGKGAVFERLVRQGHAALYEAGPAGFAAWLKFVLNPRYAPLLDEAYAGIAAQAFGLMTWRFLRLACAGLEAAVQTLKTSAELQAYVQKHYALHAVLRQENLRADLQAVLTGPLAAAFADQDGLKAWIAQAPRVNESSGADAPVTVPAKLLSRLLQREGFLYDNYYPTARQQMRAGIERVAASSGIRQKPAEAQP